MGLESLNNKSELGKCKSNEKLEYTIIGYQLLILIFQI